MHMIKGRIHILILLLLLASATLRAQSFQYEGKRVNKISIVVHHLAQGDSFDAKAILSRMKTKEGELFSQMLFDGDLKMLSQEYDRLEPSVDFVDGQLFINLSLWPKPVIRSIRWYGNKNVSKRNLQKELGIKVGSIFDRQSFMEAFNKVKEYYIKKGYFEVNLEYTVNRDELTNDVDIDICIGEGRAGRVKEVVFKGFTKGEEKALLEMIMTKRFNIFTSIFTGEGTFREEVIQQDELVMVEHLQNHGYADAAVDIAITDARERNRIIVTVTAHKGDVYRFGAITIEGNTLFSDEEIWKRMSVTEGSIFSPKRLRDSSQAITEAYGACGYIDAFVGYYPHLDDTEAKYHVDFKIEEGCQYHVGMVNIIGNTATENRIILHESLLVPGEVFNIHKLKLTEQKLLAIGYFSHVNVYAVRPCEGSILGGEYRDVNIEVEETTTGSFSAFFGFSTLDRVFGGVEITERNFNICGLNCLSSRGVCALRGGGEYLHVSTTVGQRQNLYGLSWAKPFFMDTPWVVGFDVERARNRITSKSYEINSWSGSVYAWYPINQFLRFGVHYRIRDSEVSVRNIDEVGAAAIDPLLRNQEGNRNLTSAVGVSLMYDSTDCILKPSSGFRSTLQAEYVGLGGDEQFGALGYVNSYYLPLDCKNIMKFRGDARFLFPMGSTNLADIPLDERLYTGGETSVRGYRPFAIGPTFRSGEPSGGLSQILFSIEHQYCLFKKVDLFAFFDAGSVSEKHFNVDTIRSSVGYGARLSLLGPNAPPVTIGMGYPIKFYNKSKEKNFFLSLGGRF